MALLLIGVRDFPAPDGRCRGRLELHRARRGSASSGCCGCGTTARARSTTRSGSATATTATISDHDIWRLPQADDRYGGRNPLYRYIRHRPVFRAGPPGSPVSPNLAGRDAAAFALCFQVFRRSDPAARRPLPAVGRAHLRAWPTPIPRHLLTVIPCDFYPETEWRDDLELGAVELADALADGGLPAGLPHRDPRFYLRAAARWAHAYIAHIDGNIDTLNLYDVSGLAHYELYRTIGRLRQSARIGRDSTGPARWTAYGSSTRRRPSLAATPSASATRGTSRTPPRTASASP